MYLSVHGSLLSRHVFRIPSEVLASRAPDTLDSSSSVGSPARPRRRRRPSSVSSAPYQASREPPVTLSAADVQRENDRLVSRMGTEVSRMLESQRASHLRRKLSSPARPSPERRSVPSQPEEESKEDDMHAQYDGLRVGSLEGEMSTARVQEDAKHWEVEAQRRADRNAKELLLAYERNMQCETELNKLTLRLEQVETEKEELRGEVARLGRDEPSREQRVNEEEPRLKRELESAKRELDELKQQQRELQQRLRESSSSLEELTEERDALRRQVDESVPSQEQVAEERDALRRQVDESSAIREQRHLDERMEQQEQEHEEELRRAREQHVAASTSAKPTSSAPRSMALSLCLFLAVLTLSSVLGAFLLATSGRADTWLGKPTGDENGEPVFLVAHMDAQGQWVGPSEGPAAWVGKWLDGVREFVASTQVQSLPRDHGAEEGALELVCQNTGLVGNVTPDAFRHFMGGREEW